MTAAVRVLEVATAPRDVPTLCQHSAYALYKFAEKIGMCADPSADAAFQHLSRADRAEQVSAALRAIDAKSGGAPAPQMQAPPPPAPTQVQYQPAAPQGPVAPGGAPAPAVSGRKPRNTAAAQQVATPPGQQAAPQPQPMAPQGPAVDPAALGMIAAMKDELAVVSANVKALSTHMFSLSKQIEQLGGNGVKIDAIIFMLAQIGENSLGAPAQDLINDAFKSAQQGKG